MSVNVYGVESADWTVCTLSLNLTSCDARKKLVFMVKNSAILLIFNLVFQINFQDVFYCNCASKYDAECGKLQVIKMLAFYLRTLMFVTHSGDLHVKTISAAHYTRA